jgi:hypothetical protein
VDRSSWVGSQVLGSVEADGVDLVDDVRGVRAEMHEIGLRHRDGVVTAEERRRYLACWQGLALRRSPGRRPRLSREFDAVLAKRARLLREIRDERTRQEVDAIFGAPEDGAPHGTGSPVPL